MVSHAESLHREVKILEKLHLWLLGEEADGGISTRGEDPWLRGVKRHIQNAEVVSHHMTSEDFHWNDERVLQQVTVGVARRVGLECTSEEDECMCEHVCARVHELLVNCPMTDDH